MSVFLAVACISCICFSWPWRRQANDFYYPPSKQRNDFQQPHTLNSDIVTNDHSTARKRNKDLVAHLQIQVEELPRYVQSRHVSKCTLLIPLIALMHNAHAPSHTHIPIFFPASSSEKNELHRTNEVMRAQMNLLEETNRSLLLNQMTNGGMGGMGGGGGLAGLSALGGAGRLLGGAPGFGAAGIQGLLGGGGAGQASNFLDHLTMERIAAQNRIQALRQASQQGGMDNNNNNSSSNNNTDNLNTKQGFYR